MRNLQLSDETTQSLEASWEMEDPHVERYRISYAGIRGDYEEESVSCFKLKTVCVKNKLIFRSEIVKYRCLCNGFVLRVFFI